ncbi:unnamed protein product [Taenia asiatica]|uniref:Ig-like domain-containing protein n=1 Tax=Taenia asiatica TaxID=60517 RepID=A0A158R992_TAEAS|nr:unnamed protein product [Taenia asiatica]
MVILLVHIFSLLILTVSKTLTTQAIVVGSNTSHSDSSQSEERRETHEVQFHYRIAANRMGHLTCEVMLSWEASQALVKSGNQSLSHVYLRCPQVPTEICYVDCTPACVFDEVKGCVVPTTLSTVIEGCRFEQRVESGSLLLEYTVAMEALDRTGDWNCEYQGVSAPRSLKLQASPQPPSTTAKPTIAPATSTTTTTTTTTAIAPVVTMKARFLPSAVKGVRPKSDRMAITESASLLEGEVSNGDVLWSKTPQTKYTSFIFSNFFLVLSQVRPEIVLALIALAVVAILLSIALSIRCAMTKCYFDSLQQENPDHCLGRCLCFEPSLGNSPIAKCRHHSQASQSHVPYGLKLPPPPPPPPPPPTFFAPYQVDQQSDSGGLPAYTRNISLGETTNAKLLAQQPPGTLSTASSSDTGTSNPFPVSLSGTLPVYYPGKRDSIEIGSVASDPYNQTKVYLIKMVDPSGDHHQQHHQQQQPQKTQIGSSINNTVYDEEVLNSGGRGNFHAVNPTLVRLSNSTEAAGLILCHRLADDGSSLSKTQSEADFAAARRLPPSSPQTQSYVLLSSPPPPPPPPPQPNNVNVN